MLPTGFELESTEEIQNKWMKLQYRIHILLFAVTLILEILMYFLMDAKDNIDASRSRYFLKYCLIPSGCNLVFVLGSRWSLRSRKVVRDLRPLLMSAFLLLSCTMLYIVHSTFGALTIVFSIPVLISVVYGNYSLTTVIALTSLFLRILAENLPAWDSTRESVWSSVDARFNYIISLIMQVCLYLLILVITYFEKMKNQAIEKRMAEREKLLQEIRTDALTGLCNRLAFESTMQALTEEKVPDCILAMVDFDHFKQINDRYGHPVGDQYLAFLGRVLRETAPRAEAFRYGGDEFCLLFCETPLEEAEKLCREIQEKMKEAKSMEPSFIPTLSIGLAQGRDGMTARELLAEADQVLYRAKAKRNCCIAEGQ